MEKFVVAVSMIAVAVITGIVVKKHNKYFYKVRRN